MTVPYADAADFRAFIAPGTSSLSDDEIVRQLTRASELLDDTVTAPFDIDDGTSLPTDTEVAQALKDAACAQVEFWGEVGECADIDGLAGTDVRIGSYDGKRSPELAPRAERLLHNGGLLSTQHSADPAWRFFALEAG